MAFTFGEGTKPEGLIAELDWSERLVRFQVTGRGDTSDATETVCTIPLSQLLLLREQLGEEVAMRLQVGQ